MIKDSMCRGKRSKLVPGFDVKTLPRRRSSRKAMALPSDDKGAILSNNKKYVKYCFLDYYWPDCKRKLSVRGYVLGLSPAKLSCAYRPHANVQPGIAAAAAPVVAGCRWLPKERKEKRNILPQKTSGSSRYIQPSPVANSQIK